MKEGGTRIKDESTNTFHNAGIGFLLAAPEDFKLNTALSLMREMEGTG